MNKQYSDDLHSLSHTKWRCKYHVVFAPKYRRKAFYDERRVAIGAILRQLCEWKGVNIIEAEVCIDHVHMLIEIPPKYSISGFMGFLKGKSSQIIFERWANARYKYRHREFWCRGYYVDTYKVQGMTPRSRRPGGYVRPGQHCFFLSEYRPKQFSYYSSAPSFKSLVTSSIFLLIFTPYSMD